MPAARPFTLLDEQRAVELTAEVEDGRVLLHRDALRTATGWDRKPEGLCREAMCVPVRDPELDAPGKRVDLAAFARALRRPLAVDVGEGVAALGTAAAERREQLASGQAPEFALPDLDGRLHRLSDLRGRKVLLAAYASW